MAANSVTLDSVWLVRGREMTKDEGKFSWPWKVVRMSIGFVQGSGDRLNGFSACSFPATAANTTTSFHHHQPPSPYDGGSKFLLILGIGKFISLIIGRVSGCIVACFGAN